MRKNSGLIILFFFLSCSYSADTKVKSSDTLNGTWRLSAMPGELKSLKELFSTRLPEITLIPDSNRIYGFTGCNDFGGVIRIKNDSITFITPFEMTQVGCPGGGEEKLSDIFTRTRHYKIKSDSLMLYTSLGLELIFRKLNE